MASRVRYNIAYVPSVFEYETERGEVYVYVLEASPAMKRLDKLLQEAGND